MSYTYMSGWWFRTSSFHFISPYIGNNHPNWLILRGWNHQPDVMWYLFIMYYTYIVVNIYCSIYYYIHHIYIYIYVHMWMFLKLVIPKPKVSLQFGCHLRSPQAPSRPWLRGSGCRCWAMAWAPSSSWWDTPRTGGAIKNMADVEGFTGASWIIDILLL